MSNRNPGKGILDLSPESVIPFASTSNRIIEMAGVYTVVNRLSNCSTCSIARMLISTGEIKMFSELQAAVPHV